LSHFSMYFTFLCNTCIWKVMAIIDFFSVVTSHQLLIWM
jgi:hypothetical protein